MRAHSKFPPSAALRSLNCPPSLLLGEQFEDEESVYRHKDCLQRIF